ncbi:hypothetical protein EPUS_07129 [Endocarpon pusillum Z07020]|uniref:Uncharacterized protein n=1 Tax=Endocarpon pusillum (strain Z07020 / HMAS-L-300199) TaxID=1263415 RepID=U1HRB3_ENDPU|nr:uncharacterized protein EPUS_07129 [Endocarpon pusillum Z07020]ERF73035.1 hypothetical protein EPUS_07129 [Endocarpon pusillum Z07020]
MKYLHDLGNSDINLAGGRYGTALQSSCVAGHLGAFNHLIEWGANVNAKGGEFGTALNAAAAKGQEVMVKCLVNRGASSAFTDAVERTPLFLACWNGHLEVVKLLIEQQAEVDVKTTDGRTPLHGAAWNGHLEVVKFLVKQQAEMNVKTTEGRTPLYEALTKSKIDINSKDAFYRTPIHLAISHGQFSIARLLFEHASNPSILDGYGKSALDWACMNPNIFTLMWEWRSIYIPTSQMMQIQSLHQSIRQLSERLLETKLKGTSPGFYELGHCLMFLQEFEQANFSFQQQVVEYPQVDKLRACQNHEFLEVSCPNPPILETKSIKIISNDVEEWLRRLAARYPE